MNRFSQYFRADFTDLARIYAERKPEMDRFAAELRERIAAVLDKAGVPYVRVEARVKSLESFLEKCMRKNLNNPFMDCIDLIGLRVIHPCGDDRERVEQAVIASFEVLERLDKRKEHGYKVFAYTAVHLHLLHEGRVFELQIRTLIQNTWATLDGLLFYKTGDLVPAQIRRKMNRLLALFEIADDEFQSLKDELSDYVGHHVRAAEETLAAMPLDLTSLEVYQRATFPDLRFVREDVDCTVHILHNLGVGTIGQLAEIFRRIENLRLERAAEMPDEAGDFDFHLFVVIAHLRGWEGAARPVAKPNGKARRPGA